MKKRNLFALGLAMIAFTACSNEDVVSDITPGGTTNSSEEAWFSLNIKTTTGSGKRSLNTDPDDPATAPDETEIASAKAIFFKYTGNTSPIPLAQTAPDDFIVVDVVDLSAAEIGTPGQGAAGTAGSAFKISKEIEYLLFVGNPPTNFPAIVKNVSTFADVNKAIKVSSVADVSTSEKFMMTNAKGDLEPSVSEAPGSPDPTLKKITTYKTAELAEATGAPTSITIDRVVSKVRVYTASNIAKTSKLKFQDLGWLLNVTNKYFYPVSERIKTNLENAVGYTTWVWSDVYHIGSYRRDPNHNNNNTLWGDTSSETPTTTGYADNYDYYHSGSTIAPAAWKTLGEAGNSLKPSAILYCLENTQIAAQNMHAYTTQVLLKGIINPASYLKPDQTSETASGTAHDWMVIGTGFYTPATLKLWIKAELEADRTSLAIAFNTYLAALEALGATGIEEVAIVTTNPTTIAQTISDFNDQIDLVALYAGRAGSYGSVDYYAGGVSYYKIMIKHDNDTDKSNNELGEFGVVRNSVYDINITSINSPGYPKIPDPKPETPDEVEEAWLSLDIKVNEWTWYSQEEEL